MSRLDMSAPKRPILNVRFVEGDMTTVSADAVVTLEDPDLEHESCATTSLINKFPEFREIRALLKRKTFTRLSFGKVLPSFLGQSRKKHKFIHVLHAVFDGKVIDKRKANFVIQNIELLYTNIFEASENLKIHSVALPLLGTGSPQTDDSLALEALAKSIVNTYFVSLTDLMVVSSNKDFLNRAKRRLVYEGQGKIKNVIGRLKIDGQAIESMESQADRDRYKSAPTSTTPGKTNNTYNDKAKSGKSTTWYIDDIQKGRSAEGIGQQYSAFGLNNKKPLASGRHKDISDQTCDTIPGSHSKTQPYVGGGYEESRLKHLANQGSVHQASLDVRPKSSSRNRHGYSEHHDQPVDPQISDELYARSLQHKEESRSGQSVEEEYRKFGRTDEDQRPQEDSQTPENQQDTKSSTFKDDGQEETCSICLNTISNPKILDKCGHVFCTDCIDRSFQEYKPVCPSCNMVYGEIRGNQPDGQMDEAYSRDHLPGYEGHGTITITYRFPGGIQQQAHPSPGKPYSGTTRRAYLPDNREGNEILALLREAFDRKLTFTIGRSTTTGRDGVITWNDIHHKTSMDGGPTRFGYPDPTYLSRVREELASKGVTEQPLNKRDKAKKGGR